MILKEQKEFKQESVIIGSGNSANVSQMRVFTTFMPFVILMSQKSQSTMWVEQNKCQWRVYKSSVALNTGDEIGLGQVKLKLNY